MTRCCSVSCSAVANELRQHMENIDWEESIAKRKRIVSINHRKPNDNHKCKQTASTPSAATQKNDQNMMPQMQQSAMASATNSQAQKKYDVTPMPGDEHYKSSWNVQNAKTNDLESKLHRMLAMIRQQLC